MGAQDDPDRNGVPRPWLGTGLIAFAAVSFGIVTTLSRLAYDGGGNPLALLVLRFAAFVAVAGVLLRARRRPLSLTPRGFRGSLWLAAAMFAMSAGYLTAVAYIPVGLAAIIFYSFPLLVGVVASASGREPMTVAKAAALVVAFAGLALALGPSLGGLDARGVAAAVVAALGITVTIVFSGAVTRGNDTLVVNFWTNLWMLVAASACVAAWGTFALPVSGPGLAGALGATLCYVVAFVAWFAGMRFLAPARTAMLFNIEPVVSIATAALVLGERLSAVQLVGVAAVLAAIAARTLGDRPRPGRA